MQQLNSQPSDATGDGNTIAYIIISQTHEPLYWTFLLAARSVCFVKSERITFNEPQHQQPRGVQIVSRNTPHTRSHTIRDQTSPQSAHTAKTKCMLNQLWLQYHRHLHHLLLRHHCPSDLWPASKNSKHVSAVNLSKHKTACMTF